MKTLNLKKILKIQFIFSIIILLVYVLVGCGKKDSGGSGTVATSPIDNPGSSIDSVLEYPILLGSAQGEGLYLAIDIKLYGEQDEADVYCANDPYHYEKCIAVYNGTVALEVVITVKQDPQLYDCDIPVGDYDLYTYKAGFFNTVLYGVEVYAIHRSNGRRLEGYMPSYQGFNGGSIYSPDGDIGKSKMNRITLGNLYITSSEGQNCNMYFTY